MSHPDNETVMAASERLMELIEKRDEEEALREREDRLWEMAGEVRGMIEETERQAEANGISPFEQWMRECEERHA